MPDAQNQHKPDVKCRTCTDFKTWTKQQKAFSTKTEDSPEEVKTKPDVIETPIRKDCPLDRDQLGSSTWSFLHTIAAVYPERPSAKESSDVKQFFSFFSKVYPCDYCAKDFQLELKKEPIDTTSQDTLSQWLCRMHNKVNVKVGKPIFDCSKVNERWRDGWKDGSCD